MYQEVIPVTNSQNAGLHREIIRKPDKRTWILKNVIARSRFELLSRDPESRMIDRYTTGLCLYDYAAGE